MIGSRIAIGVIGTVVVGILAVGTLLFLNPQFKLDGLQGLLLGVALDEDTRYAPGYTDRAFCKIHPGMRAAAVRGTLGAPLKRWNRRDGFSDMTWDYSCSPSHTHYRIRQVDLHADTVIAVRSYFYVD